MLVYDQFTTSYQLKHQPIGYDDNAHVVGHVMDHDAPPFDKSRPNYARELPNI